MSAGGPPEIKTQAKDRKAAEEPIEASSDDIFQKLERVVYLAVNGDESKEKEIILIPRELVGQISDHPDFIRNFGNKSVKSFDKKTDSDEDFDINEGSKSSLRTAPGKI